MTWLMQGDCLDRMAEIPDGSVDLVLTDPPYGTTACKWDAVIPFEPMWAQVKRVTKPNAAIVLTASQPFTSALVMSNPKWFRYEWVWKKTRPIGHGYARFRPMSLHETVLVFAQRKATYNPLMIPRDKPRSYTRNKASITEVAGMDSDDGKVRTLTHKHPVTVLEFGNADQAGKAHPTQKPVALMEYLTRTYTNPGETVLDFTMGSGTTGVACVNTGRRFIGIERDETYFQIAQSRIAEAQLQLMEPPCYRSSSPAP